MRKHSDHLIKWILIGAVALVAVVAIVVILRKPGTDGKTEIVTGESVTAEAMEAGTDSVAGIKENGSVSSGIDPSAMVPTAAGADAKLSDTQNTAETFETEIVAVVDIHEKAVEALAEERSAVIVQEISPEVAMEEVVIEEFDDSDDGGNSGTKEQQESGRNNESSATPGETDTKPDGQKESETEATSPVESSPAESKETESSVESSSVSTEADTETTPAPVVQLKELVLGEESIRVPADAPESIQEFDALSGESKYSLALAFDSVTKYNEYIMLLQKAADRARIEADGDAVVD